MDTFDRLSPHPLRLGTAFVPHQAPERLQSLVTAAEESGLDEFWVWEDCFSQSGIASATAALAHTRRIRVGLGLMPAPLRNVALTAMEIATVDRMFPGRFIPGVGHGVQHWMGQAGVRVASPMTLLREYATALRRLLSGDQVSVQGRYVRLDEVRLDWPPAAPILTMGGLGPKTLRLSAELADGILLATALTEEEVRSSVETVREALPPRAGGSTTGAGPYVLATLIAATGPDARRRLDEEVPRWGKQPGQGIGAAGDAEALAAAALRLADVGATSVCFQPTADEPDVEGFIRFVGEKVRPLVLAGSSSR